MTGTRFRTLAEVTDFSNVEKIKLDGSKTSMDCELVITFKNDSPPVIIPFQHGEGIDIGTEADLLERGAKGETE